MSKEVILGALSEAHDSLLIAADVAVTRDEHHHDGWGVREILAHVAAWEREAIQRIPLLATGATDQVYDVDHFNADAIAALGDQPLGHVRADLEATHAHLVTLLDGMGEEAFERGGAAYDWARLMTRHSRIHAQDLTGGSIEKTE